jgi:hypothetical protein
MKTTINLNGWEIEYSTKVVGRADPTQMQVWKISKGAYHIYLEEFQNQIQMSQAPVQGEPSEEFFDLSDKNARAKLDMKLEMAVGFSFSEMGEAIAKQLEKEIEDDPFHGDDPFFGGESKVDKVIDQLVTEETAEDDDYANRFIHQYKQARDKIVELLKAAGHEDAHIVLHNKILVSGVEYYMDPYEGEGVVEVDDEDGKTVTKFRPNMVASIERAASAIIANLEEWLEAGEEGEGASEYEPGDPIDVEVGDRVDAGAYGKLWITSTGVVGDLWTSEDQDDIDTQRGRGLRYGYVSAVQKQGRGPWIKVKFDRDNGAYEVVA